MTKEEAIKILNIIIYIIPKEYCNEETEGAIEMAINSLEAWEKVEADILGLDGYYDDAFWEGTYAVSKIIGKRLAEVTK